MVSKLKDELKATNHNSFDAYGVFKKRGLKNRRLFATSADCEWQTVVSFLSGPEAEQNRIVGICLVVLHPHLLGPTQWTASL